MNNKQVGRVLDPRRKKILIRNIVIYLILIVFIFLNLVNVFLTTKLVDKENLTDIIGRVTEINKVRPVQHSTIYLEFIVDNKTYLLYCYNDIEHSDEIIERIKEEESITLLVKNRKSLLGDDTVEIVGVSGVDEVYYDVDTLNIQRKNYRISFSIFYGLSILIFTLVLVLYHLTDVELIYKRLKKMFKVNKKLCCKDR